MSLPPDVRATGLRTGDRVLLYDLTAVPGETGGGFEFYLADRSPALLWLAVLFGLVVVLVARRRGAMALVSLGFAGVVVAGFLIPSLLSGQPAVPATLLSDRPEASPAARASSCVCARGRTSSRSST